MKTIVRFMLLFALLILSVSFLMAQTGSKDVVYLKNGSIVKGTILEMVMDKTVKIQTPDGNVFIFTMSEVEKISKESASSNEVTAAPEQSSKGAGSSFILYGGASLPTGDFAKDNNENAGFAKTGWLAGAQFVTGGSVGVLVDLSYSNNPSNLNKVFSGGTGNTSISNWTSILLLAGFKIGTSNATDANFFFAPVVGANFVKTPEVSYKYSGPEYVPSYYDNYPPYTYHPGYTMYVNGEATLPSISKTVVVYGAAVEAIIGSITVGARYLTSTLKYDLEIKVTATGTAPGYPPQTKNETYKVGTWEPSISVAQVYLGIAF